MKTNLTPVKRGEEVDIFVDVFSDSVEANICFAAKPISFRITRRYAVDQPSCSENGPLLTLSVDEARKFAEHILEVLGD